MLKKPYRKIESFDIENALCTPIPESLRKQRDIRLVKVYELAPRVGNLSSLALGNA